MTAPWITRQLQSLLGQRGHALLLAGPSGLGQYELALALARAWLCERPTNEGACGQCGSCHAIDVRTHADLMVLLPETLALELDWPLEEKTRDKIEKKEIKPSKWIRVDAAREVVAFAQTTRARGNTKVVLVYPADRLNVESANTLLKTLEEPAGELRFVLATEAAHLLPATIRSRCQAHALAWPEPDEALAWLQTHTDVRATPANAATWLKASGGRPDDALAWGHLDLTPVQWAALPKQIAAGDASTLAAWQPSRQLDVFQKLAHDLLAVQSGGAPRYFNAQDLPQAPAGMALQAWSTALLAAAKTVEHPVGPGLMLEAWLARAAQTLNDNIKPLQPTARANTLRT